MSGEARVGPFLIRQGFPEPERQRAAEIYWEAFRDKLGRVMGPDRRALTFLATALRADHCLSAVDDQGRLLGLAGFKTPQGCFAGGSTEEMRKVYGRFGTFWRGFLLRRLASDVDNDNFLIDGIAVTAAARGQGIGTALLSALSREAEARRYPALRLEVAAENSRAQALYAREGYVYVMTSKTGLLRYFFRFRAAHTMLRPVG